MVCGHGGLYRIPEQEAKMRINRTQLGLGRVSAWELNKIKSEILH